MSDLNQSNSRRKPYGVKVAMTVMALFAAPLAVADTQKPDEIIQEIGAAERVAAAARLQVLSQEAASAACHMAHDINPDMSRELLVEAKTEFNQLLDALQLGSPDLGIIGEERRRKTISKIEMLRSDWAPIFEASASLLENPANTDALLLIKTANEAILENASLLTSDIEGTYANPVELTQADTMLIEFSARQVVLTQKLAKLACEVWVGNRSEDRLAELGKSIQNFDATLMAMLNGLPALGIHAAPTPEIEQALLQANSSWASTKTDLETVLSGETVTQSLKENLFHNLNLAMSEMTHIEHLYVEFSKH